MSAENECASERVRAICRQLEAGRYQCAINCYSAIRRKDRIWCCNTCFHIFHMKCVEEWAKKSQGSSFCCPQCRQTQSFVNKYFCFCGKVENPTQDPGITPHSCGKTCGKKRPFCPHPCPLQCHPGPCPPCSLQKGPTKCPCGSSSYTYRCGMEDPKKTCENSCGKVLNCGIHKCSLKCHIEPCDLCMVETVIECHCGREKKEFLCGTTFSCNQVCDKVLRCGNHKCQEICHVGECSPCPFSPERVKTCHCGSLPLKPNQRIKCTDPVPSCGKKCNKWLECGRHRCLEVCHDGICPVCTQFYETSCLCGKERKKMILCSKTDSFRCDRPCGTQLSCQRHKCMKKCCPDNGKKEASSHACMSSCDKKLPCGHACILPCHRGRCPPCLAMIPSFLTCRCGCTVSDPPPLPCGTAPPICKEPCSLERPCGHSSADHTCHFGECPPCTAEVERICVGHNKPIRVTCGSSVVQCDEICGKHIGLGCHHTCPRLCHVGECMEKGLPCKLQCGKKRDECFHYCKRQCHKQEPCPECTQKVRLTCKCGKHIYNEKCAVARLKFLNGESADEKSFEGVLECNDNCYYANRLEALSSRKRVCFDEDFIFIESLYSLGSNNLEYIDNIEKRFMDLINGDTPIVSLPPTSRERRKIVHLLAKYYRIDVLSEDNGELRSCIISKTAYSTPPKVLLSDHIRKKQNIPSKFIEENKKYKSKQLRVKLQSKILVNLLVAICGYFTFVEQQKDEEYCILYFTSQGRREEACSILRRNGIVFSRLDEVK